MLALSLPLRSHKWLVCIYVCIHVCMYICMYIHIFMYVRMYVCMYIVYCMYVSLVSSFAGSLLKRRPSVILVLTCPLGMVQEAALGWGWPFWRQRWPSLRLSASSGLCRLQRQRWGSIYGICHYNVILPFCFNKTVGPFYCPFVSFHFILSLPDFIDRFN